MVVVNCQLQAAGRGAVPPGAPQQAGSPPARAQAAVPGPGQARAAPGPGAGLLPRVREEGGQAQAGAAAAAQEEAREEETPGGVRLEQSLQGSPGQIPAETQEQISIQS